MEEMFLEIEKIANAAANTIASPNWADILSVVLSLSAVIIAGLVAWKQIKIAKKQNAISEEQTKISKMQTNIADKQNKISLFEKRYSAYEEIINVLSLARDFDCFRSCTIYEYFIGILLTLNYPEPQRPNPNTFVYHASVDSTTSLIKQSAFLFPNIQKVDAENLSKKFRHFFVSIETATPNDREKKVSEYYEANADIKDFFDASRAFSDKYLEIMEEFLRFEER